MNVQVIYCTHQTTTLALRERLAFASVEQLTRAYESLARPFPGPSTSFSPPAIASRFMRPRMKPTLP